MENRVRLLAACSDGIEELEPGMAKLRASFSEESELAALSRFVTELRADTAATLSGQTTPAAPAVRLQKRMRLGRWLALRKVRARRARQLEAS